MISLWEKYVLRESISRVLINTLMQVHISMDANVFLNSRLSSRLSSHKKASSSIKSFDLSSLASFYFHLSEGKDILFH